MPPRLLGLAAALVVAACSPKAATVENAWVRLPAVSGQPGAAYFTVVGGGRGDEVLVAVTTPAAIKAEMHQSMTGAHGMTTMAPVQDLTIPANRDVAFAPGGRHVMLFGLKPEVKPGGSMPLTFTFLGGQKVTVTARVVGAGDTAPQ